jgi:alcohol dehydrogenase, propanol-preferring
MALVSNDRILKLLTLPDPDPGPGQALIKVNACGVCRTDLHIIDGELPPPALPIVPGHEIAGTVVRTGPDAGSLKPGDRVGVPWLASTCGQCAYCKAHRENLCDNPLFTGYSVNGGFAEYTVARAEYCFPLPPGYGDIEAAPLLCAGLIGYRSYSMLDPDTSSIGLYGFGAAAHILTQVAAFHGKKVYAFTRPGDFKAQEFARGLGAVWAGDSRTPPPVSLDASIIFAPVGALVPAALASIKKGGLLVCGGIHMSDIPSFPYRLLWQERRIRSVANLTRKDGIEFMGIASRIPLKIRVSSFPLEQANHAVDLLRSGRVEGAVVLKIG